MTARSRLPRRPTDRLEDVAAWLLSAAGMVVLAAAVVLGLAFDAQILDRDRATTTERTRVDAVVVERVPLPNGQYGTASARTAARARWTAPDGRARSGFVLAGPGTEAGAVVPIWTDRDGFLLAEPTGPVGAAVLGVLLGVGVLGIGGCLIAAAWAAARHLLDGRHAAYWAREWARVGPAWSRQAR